MNPVSLPWADLGLYASAFAVGAVAVKRFVERRHRLVNGRAGVGDSGGHGDGRARPPNQLPVRGFDGVVDWTNTQVLLQSIERRTRLSQAVWQRDCRPVLESFGEFVQGLPASECHHHAQPGGLWIHALEVTDAALTFRAGLELPPGASTETRKRLEHRWTVTVLLAAMLHDVGKPVTDVRVTLYNDDPRAGRPWAALAGSMRAFGAAWYSVSFAEPAERNYQHHSKLAAMLLHAFVPPRVMRWLAEDGDVLSALLAYLAGDDPDGVLGSIIKRADSDSVRRNLLNGPRTRFATARSQPLIERLMEALRRMLSEGAVLPLNRPGAAGWVFDGCVWFVCARLADEVRTYLSEHESVQGVPGRDRNDRLFDTWQESGAARPAPDGGAVWRVKVTCDGWTPPDPLTVLCVPLDRLYADPAAYPPSMRGSIVPIVAAGPQSAAHQPVREATPHPVEQRTTTTQAPRATPATAAPRPQSPRSEATASDDAASAASASISTAGSVLNQLEVRAPAPVIAQGPEKPGKRSSLPSTSPATTGPANSAETPDLRRNPSPSPAPPLPAEPPSSPASEPRGLSAMKPLAESASSSSLSDDVLAPSDAASLRPDPPPSGTYPAEPGAPLRPKDKQARHPAPVKDASVAAKALMAWIAHSVASGELKYNEDGALVHFVAEGALLLSPEIFRRFVDTYAAPPQNALSDPVHDAVASLKASHGERAYARLQNELAKSGWAVRNGDENLHYYAFVKSGGSLSKTASFYLIGRPDLFWNPLPPPNERIRRAPKPKRLAVPAGTAGSSQSAVTAATGSR
jgi:integrating conjugative element relaxase (TIGR03760 family)